MASISCHPIQLSAVYSQNLYPIPFQEAGPSRALIVVESSSSDEPIAPVPEKRVALPSAQAREIRFKEVINLSPESADPLLLLANPCLYSFAGTRHSQ